MAGRVWWPQELEEGKELQSHTEDSCKSTQAEIYRPAYFPKKSAFWKQQQCARNGPAVEEQTPSDVTEERNKDTETIEDKWERMQA